MKDEYVKDKSRIVGPARVKDSIWRDEIKPWADPPLPSKTLHTSIEHHYFYRTALRLGKGNYANLGVYRGHSINSLAHGIASHGGMVYGVDFFDTEESGAFNIEKMTEVFESVNLSKFITLCKGDTKDWAGKLSHLRFKFIFIDADHSYAGCLSDFKLWSPLLEPEGEIAFHDVDINSIHAVIADELSDWELVDHVYRIKSFKRIVK